MPFTFAAIRNCCRVILICPLIVYFLNPIYGPRSPRSDTILLIAFCCFYALLSSAVICYTLKATDGEVGGGGRQGFEIPQVVPLRNRGPTFSLCVLENRYLIFVPLWNSSGHISNSHHHYFSFLNDNIALSLYLPLFIRTKNTQISITRILN